MYIDDISVTIMTSKRKYRCVQYPTFAWRTMQPGVERRLAIIDHVLQMRGMLVNKRWMLQTDKDQDLKKMLKDGTLVRRRESNGSKFSRVTVLYLK